MNATRSVLVVGGGTAGNALAVLLRRAGIAVDLVEARPDGNATAGSGITLQGNALRVLREVGVWEQVSAHGYGTDGITVATADGTEIVRQQQVRTGGSGLPAALGMRRPVLQRILMEAVRTSGARVHLGCTVQELTDGASGVEVSLTDGTSGRYDLVVAADGLNSPTRARIGITDAPAATGLGIWRATAPRPAGVTRIHVAYGGSALIAGFSPTGPDTLYAYLVEPQRERSGLAPGAYAQEMCRLAAEYGGHWDRIRASITDPAQVNYTWAERHLVRGAWHRGRVVLVGDAAHTCPPTLAQGAAMSLEDASVLAQLLVPHAAWGANLQHTLTAYRDRRFPRVRRVVDASVQIGRWQLAGADDADVPGLMGRTFSALVQLP